MKLLTAIHDVTPAHRERIEALWGLCREHGLRPALFCVPAWHGGHRLDADPAFVRWLQARAAEGAEILLHGWRHDEVGNQRTVADHWRAWGRTAREGEFLVLDSPAAARRMADGLALLRRLGLDPVGFVAPAWLGRPELPELVRRAGLRVTEDAHAVHCFPIGRRAHSVRAPAVRWSARSPWRAAGSAAVAQARWALGQRLPLVRLAFHPTDLTSAVVTRSVRAALGRWTRDRTAVGYAQVADAGAGT